MYETKQNKDTASRTISSIQKKNKSRIATNIQNGFFRSRPTIDDQIIQRHLAVVTGEEKPESFIDYATVEQNMSIDDIVTEISNLSQSSDLSKIAEYQLATINKETVLNYLRLIVESPTPPLQLEYGPDNYSVINSGGILSDSNGEEYLAHQSEERIGVFKNYENLRRYLIEYIIRVVVDSSTTAQEQTSDEQTPIIINEEQSSFFYSTYGRYPTIYSYGMDTGSNRVSENKQGPHTLAHSSVDYLMDIAPTEYDFSLQILSPQDVEQLLSRLYVYTEAELKSSKYMQDYFNKYNEFMEKKHQGKALYRELMEMHPMAVYGWLGNIKKGIAEQPIPASKTSRKGKGERYGQTLYFDKQWARMKNVGNEDILNKEMENYLRLRLSMGIKEDRIMNIINTLLTQGQYTIEPEQDMLIM